MPVTMVTGDPLITLMVYRTNSLVAAIRILVSHIVINCYNDSSLFVGQISIFSTTHENIISLFRIVY